MELSSLLHFRRDDEACDLSTEASLVDDGTDEASSFVSEDACYFQRMIRDRVRRTVEQILDFRPIGIAGERDEPEKSSCNVDSEFEKLTGSVDRLPGKWSLRWHKHADTTS